jgi:diguanylate cyclase (GGDEF)-like protein
MLIVVDAFNRVLDVNRTTEAWLRKPAHEILGQDLMLIFSLWPGLAGRFQDTQDTREEIEVAGNPPRTLELIISPLYNTLGSLEGRIIMARDVTSRKTMENELIKTNQALNARIAEVDSLRARLQEQIIRDPLTGLYNRRHLTVALDDAVMQAQKKETPLALAVIDLDFFKKFNDTYGHKCGDAVLLSFAKLLSSKIQPHEIACRYGGEEFVIMMPGISLAEAAERAEDWRQAMETRTFEYNGQTLFHATMSIGIAAYPQHGQESEALLQAADQALYQSKGNGRNRVTVYQEKK